MADPASSTELAPAKRVSALVWIGGFVAFALYLVIAGLHVADGQLNADEGFYATAARAVWAGEVPYRDFGYTQMPLLPYVNGAVMKLTRFGLFEQRAINGLWAAIALGLGARLLARRALFARAIFLVALFAVTPAWQYFIHLGKTYGFVSLVAMAGATVLIEWAPGWKKTAVLSGLCVIGVGSRLPSAPFFGLLWLAAWRDRDGFNLRRVLVAAATLVLAASALLLPFYLAAPAQARFWVIDFFRVSVPLRDFHVHWQEFVALGPVVWILAVAVAGHGAWRGRRWPWPESALGIAALVALGANLLPQGAYDEYGVPFVLPLACAVLLLAPPLSWNRPLAGILAGCLLLGQVAVIPALYWPLQEPRFRSSWSRWLPPNGIPYNFALRTQVRDARRAIQQNLPPGSPFYGSAVILAVEADRPVPRRLRMGPFTVTSDFPPAEADRLHLMTYTELSTIFQSPEVRVIGVHSVNLFNYTWSMPSFRYQTPQERAEWAAGFQSYYQPAYRDPEFTVLVRR